MDFIYDVIEELIRECVNYRRYKGMTQADVGEKSGLSQQMVSRIETGAYTPTLDTFIFYVNALGLKITLTPTGSKNTNVENDNEEV